jgi:hypothetical protein
MTREKSSLHHSFLYGSSNGLLTNNNTIFSQSTDRFFRQSSIAVTTMTTKMELSETAEKEFHSEEDTKEIYRSLIRKTLDNKDQSYEDMINIIKGCAGGDLDEEIETGKNYTIMNILEEENVSQEILNDLRRPVKRSTLS